MSARGEHRDLPGQLIVLLGVTLVAVTIIVGAVGLLPSWALIVVIACAFGLMVVKGVLDNR
ncbi:MULTISPECIES: hypothetical protein [unclassified Nocardia]|uniref:hypothetical protein n=1 Tax=unclassified Nocardia TaxID=2637762 RepID=UPI001CE4050E|nr:MULTISPECIES: hypothetical protein [unclassified Nocardia]